MDGGDPGVGIDKAMSPAARCLPPTDTLSVHPDGEGSRWTGSGHDSPFRLATTVTPVADHELKVEGLKNPVDPGKAGGRRIRLDLGDGRLRKTTPAPDEVLGELPLTSVAAEDRSQLLRSPGNEVIHIL